MKSLLKHLFLGFLFLLILPAKTLFASQEHVHLEMRNTRSISTWPLLDIYIPSKDHVLEKGALKKMVQNWATDIAPESEPRFFLLNGVYFSSDMIRIFYQVNPYHDFYTIIFGTDLAQFIEFHVPFDFHDAPEFHATPRVNNPSLELTNVSFLEAFYIIDPEIIAYLVKYRKDHHDGSQYNNYLKETIKNRSKKFKKTPKENDDFIKSIILRFINRIEPVSIEDNTFEVNYWGEYKPFYSHSFFVNEPKLRRSLFYPLSKDQLIDLADVCLNADSPFDDASKEEIRAAFVDKGILSKRIKNARSGIVKNSDRITEPFLEENDDINNDVTESWVKEPFLEENDTISNDATLRQIIEMPRVEYTKSKKTVIISGTKDVIEGAIRTKKIDLTQIENIIFKSPDMTEIPGLLSHLRALKSLNISKTAIDASQEHIREMIDILQSKGCLVIIAPSMN